MRSKVIKSILFACLFAICMAYLESAIVVYLREILYPEGFVFPLKIVGENIIITELFREVVTIIMLLSIGFYLGKCRLEKFAYFILAFAVWDIFYYIFLKALIGWPESLLSWDILFLIPFNWIGPVIAPVINSITMIILALIIIVYKNKYLKIYFTLYEWLLLIIGSVIIIIAYVKDSLFFVFDFIYYKTNNLSELQTTLEKFSIEFVPLKFDWIMFSIGELCFLISIILFIQRMKKLNDRNFI